MKFTRIALFLGVFLGVSLDALVPSARAAEPAKKTIMDDNVRVNFAAILARINSKYVQVEQKQAARRTVKSRDAKITVNANIISNVSSRLETFKEPSNIIESTLIAPTNLQTNQAQLLQQVPEMPLIEQNESTLEAGIPEGEELLLAILVNKLFLADVFAIKSAAGAKVSLSSFFEIIDFPINVDLDKQTANGWFIEENNNFNFNFGANGDVNQPAQVTINGITTVVPSEHIQIEADDVYIDGSILSQWFKLNVSYDFSNLQLILAPEQPLPIQQRLARKERSILTSNDNESVMPWKESSYQLLSSPLVDIQLQHVTDKRSNHITSYSALGSHDLAYFNSEYYISGNTEDSLNSMRLKFSKQLIDNKFLGFIPVTRVEFGDINAIKSTGSFNASLNRGFLLSNYAINTADNNTINLNGDIQPGWDIELYRNSILIDKSTSVQSGRYEFNNIDLLFGNNVFEMILYGPQGQVETKRKEVYVDRNLLGSSDSSYGFSVTQAGKSVFNLDNDRPTENEGWLVSGNYSQGLTDWLSIRLGHSTLVSKHGENQVSYSAATDMTLFQRLLLNSAVSTDQNDSINMSFTAKMAVFDHSLFYSFQENRNKGEQEETTARQQIVKMNGNLFKVGSYRVNYQNQLNYNERANNDVSTRFSNQLSLSAGRFSAQNSLSWQKFDADDNSESETSLLGGTQVQFNLGPVFTRISAAYSVKPEAELSSVSSEFSWQFTDTLQSNFKLDYTLDSERYRTQLGLNWKHDYFNLGSNFTRSSDHWSLGLSFRFSFGYHLGHEKLFLSSSSLTHDGSVMVRVFEDDNGNGVYDEGENLLEGAKVQSPQNQRQGISGKDGIAIIKNMSNDVVTDIVLDRNSLDDPFLIAAGAGTAITPRKGFMEQIDYPVVSSSEIDGTIHVIDNKGNEEPMAYAEMQLLNNKGDVVSTTSAEYDGYYLFVDLKPGEYVVTIADSYIKKHKLYQAEGLAISLTAQGDVINGSDFMLAKLKFTKGYVVEAASFNSLTMLKGYWNLIHRRYRTKPNQTVFYVQDEKTNKYQLNLGFYQDKLSADTACEETANISVNCTVKPYEFVAKK